MTISMSPFVALRALSKESVGSHRGHRRASRRAMAWRSPFFGTDIYI